MSRQTRFPVRSRSIRTRPTRGPAILATTLVAALTSGVAVVGTSALAAGAPRPVAAAAAASSPVPTPPAGGSAPHYELDHAGAGLIARTPRQLLTAAAQRAAATTVPGIQGMDVSGWQKAVDWPAAWRNGARFAIVKATEGTSFRNTWFAQQYNGSAAVGMIRGAYHFALPGRVTAQAQADFFVNNGGAWTPDGRTLPPSLDIEYNPYGSNTCYGFSQAQMVAWVKAFVDRVYQRTGRHAMIYSTRDWWSQCTGNSAAFSANPLWLARYAATPGRMPAGWKAQTIWQYAWYGRFPGDQNVFNGSMAGLQALALNAELLARVPVHVEVGGPVTIMPFSVTTSPAARQVSVGLRSNVTGRTATATTVTATGSPRTQFYGTVRLTSRQLTAWGPHGWVIRSQNPNALKVLPVDVRAHSLLGLAASRSGSTVTIVGSARAYQSVINRYVAWPRRTIAIQRWTSSGWRTIGSAVTDSRGNFRVLRSIPFTVGLRLVDQASGTIWGAVSAPQVR